MIKELDILQIKKTKMNTLVDLSTQLLTTRDVCVKLYKILTSNFCEEIKYLIVGIYSNMYCYHNYCYHNYCYHNYCYHSYCYSSQANSIKQIPIETFNK